MKIFFSRVKVLLISRNLCQIYETNCQYFIRYGKLKKKCKRKTTKSFNVFDFKSKFKTRFWNFLLENGILRYMYSKKISIYEKSHLIDKFPCKIEKNILNRMILFLNSVLKSKCFIEIDRLLIEI